LARESGKNQISSEDRVKSLAQALCGSLEANIRDSERSSYEEFQRTKKIKPLKGTALRGVMPKLSPEGGHAKPASSVVVKDLESLLSWSSNAD
jgi:hypothetical protein